MYIEFFQNGLKIKIKTPRKIKQSQVFIRNTKQNIVVSVKKIETKNIRTKKLKKIGQYLLDNKISLNEYLIVKERIRNRAKQKYQIIKLKKDKNSLVKIQKNLFQCI
jgi:ribonuclease BN (tRNA processing enzyme)